MQQKLHIMKIYKLAAEKTAKNINISAGAMLPVVDIEEVSALMSRDELLVLNGSKCILQFRDVRPFLY